MNEKIKHILIAVFILACKIALAEKDSVFICKGKSSYAYHNRYCQGLKKCRASIVKVSIDEAKQMKRKACGYCYGQTLVITDRVILLDKYKMTLNQSSSDKLLYGPSR